MHLHTQWCAKIHAKGILSYQRIIHENVLKLPALLRHPLMLSMQYSLLPLRQRLHILHYMRNWLWQACTINKIGQMVAITVQWCLHTIKKKKRSHTRLDPMIWGLWLKLLCAYFIETMSIVDTLKNNAKSKTSVKIKCLLYIILN